MAPEPSQFVAPHNPHLPNIHHTLFDRFRRQRVRECYRNRAFHLRYVRSPPSRFSLCSCSFAARLVPGAFNIPARPLSTHESRHKLSVKSVNTGLHSAPRERKTLELCPQEKQQRRLSCCWRRWPSARRPAWNLLSRI